MSPMPIMQSPPGAEVMIDGRRCLYFAGTAYLGMQSHPEVIRAACEAAQQYGIGPATSRIGFGNQPPLIELEQTAAKFFGRESAFYLPSAYAAPDVLIAAIAETRRRVFVDEHAHFSVMDALARCDQPFVVISHTSAADLKLKLRKSLHPGESPLMVTDAVFPATGKVAPVPAYMEALSKYPGAALLLDDAHGVGVLGKEGRGTFEQCNVEMAHVNAPDPSRPGVQLFDCATLSKALGTYGGIMAGSKPFIERCKRASHQYDGCNGPPASIAAAASMALRLLMQDPTPRMRLAANTRLLRSGLHRIGLDVQDQPTPVVALDLGDPQWMHRAQQKLLGEGIAIGFLHYPGTGSRGMLRIAVSASHERAMIEHLIEKLRKTL